MIGKLRDVSLKMKAWSPVLQIARTFGSDMGQSIPLVSQDWANTKAAFRLFSNEWVNEADILRRRAGA
ncbi:MULTISPECIES: transposase [unclassified Bradyrhizobium]|uniref:transposase n=1 Tax=unclassified Bradyrhizobium TaxID=2631580 RepID=UPI001CD55A67|nr:MULTISPECIES: transposase [unclassified Bradyrhizobium]